MVTIRQLLSFVVFSLSISMQAYPESITVWRSPEGKLIYGIGDVHGDEASGADHMMNYNSQHKIRSIFAHIARAHKQQDYLAIVEDSSRYPGPREFIRNFYRGCGYTSWHGDDMDSETPLSGLIDELDFVGIPSVNAEFRFLKLLGIGFVRIMLLQRDRQGRYMDLTLDAEEGGQGALISSYDQEARQKIKKSWEVLKVSGHDIVQEFEEAAHEVEQYREEPLQDYYRTSLHKVRATSKRFLDSLNKDQGGIVEYFKTHIEDPQKIDFFGESVGDFDASLLEMRVLHNIITHSDVKKQLLFCGAWHIQQVGRVLKESLGYEQIAHVGVAREYPESNVTFDPTQPIVLSSGKMADCVELEEDLYDIIQSDNPEKFKPGSFPSYTFQDMMERVTPESFSAVLRAMVQASAPERFASGSFS
jgi:hypothetical protein